MNYSIREVLDTDYDSLLELWKTTHGIGIDEYSDSLESIQRFLTRNPGMSFLAVLEDGKIIASVLSGHDGRRGFIYHLLVQEKYRRFGIAAAMLEKVYKKFEENFIPKANIFVMKVNQSGIGFWTHEGWKSRNNLEIMQREFKPMGSKGNCEC